MSSTPKPSFATESTATWRNELHCSKETKLHEAPPLRNRRGSSRNARTHKNKTRPFESLLVVRWCDATTKRLSTRSPIDQARSYRTMPTCHRKAEFDDPSSTAFQIEVYVLERMWFVRTPQDVQIETLLETRPSQVRQQMGNHMNICFGNKKRQISMTHVRWIWHIKYSISETPSTDKEAKYDLRAFAPRYSHQHNSWGEGLTGIRSRMDLPTWSDQNNDYTLPF